MRGYIIETLQGRVIFIILQVGQMKKLRLGRQFMQLAQGPQLLFSQPEASGASQRLREAWATSNF